jgi:L-lactate dehydrogenase complex protein LldE
MPHATEQSVQVSTWLGAWRDEPRPKRVALFVACFNDLLFPNVGKAVVRLLDRLGVEVDFPGDQTCCGQLHFNTGYRDEASALARRFADVFADYDAIVTPSPSCAAMVRREHPFLDRDTAEVARRVVDVTEFLVDVLGVVDVGARFPHAVTLHTTCHGIRMLGIGDRPERLLDHVEGLTRVPLRNANECCGFGGTFAIKNVDTSLAMGNDKIAAVAETGAEVLTAADMSCLMHLGGLLSRNGSSIRVMHLAEILAGDGTESP